MNTLRRGTPAALLLVGLLISLPGSGVAASTTYTDETEFLLALTALNRSPTREGFEADSTWGSVRSPARAASVMSSGITWRSNAAENGITTSSGAARSDAWGVFSLPHGTFSQFTGCDVPGACSDGFVLAASAPLVAAGGWITGTAGGKIELVVDDDRANPLGFDEVCDPQGSNCVNPGVLTGEGHVFFGLIDPEGFHTLEFHEREGIYSDEKWIFGDDFSFATDTSLCVPGAPPDRDCDSIPDAADTCPYYPSASQTDSNGNGRGDACECGDQDRSGSVDVSDIVAVSIALFTPTLPRDLCDSNGDTLCNVADIVGVNNEIFSIGNTSTCSRQPVPGP